MRENTKATSLEFWSCSDLAKILTMVENFLRVCAAFGAENGRIAIWGDRPKFCWRAADQDQDARDGHENLVEASGTEKRFAGAPLTSPQDGQGPAGHAHRSKNFDRGTGDRKKFCWRAVDFASTRTRTSRPRPNLKAGKVQS